VFVGFIGKSDDTLCSSIFSYYTRNPKGSFLFGAYVIAFGFIPLEVGTPESGLVLV
jgi:hypothetical protein